MGNFSTYFPFLSSSGGGGVIDTTSVTSPTGKSYTIYDGTDITNTFEAAFKSRGWASSFPQQNLDGYVIDLKNNGSTTTGVQYSSTGVAEMSESANNNVFTTFFNDTAGGGIFYWAYIKADYGLSITSASSGTRTGNQTATLRITIDGGTPIEFNCGTGSITSPGGVHSAYNMASSGVLGFGNFLEYSVNPVSNSQYGRYPIIGGYTPTTTGTFTESFTVPNPSPSSIGTQLSFIGQNPEQLRRQGIPGINYQTSLLIEIRYNANRSGAWNGRGGSITAAASVAQF